MSVVTRRERTEGSGTDKRMRGGELEAFPSW